MSDQTPTPIDGSHRKRTKYTEEFRSKVLGLIDHGKSRREVSDEMKVPTFTIDHWVKMRRRGKGGPQKPGPRAESASPSEVTRLRQRVMELEHDLEVLEKVVVSQAVRLEHFRAREEN